jgi:hypothetical protein
LYFHDSGLLVRLLNIQTVASDFFDSLKRFQKLADDSVGQAALIYDGAQGQHRRASRVVPWKRIHDLFSGVTW